MESTTNPTYPELHIPVISLRTKLVRLTGMVIICAILIWAYQGAEINFATLYNNSGNMILYLKGFLQPDFLEWQSYLEEMLITIQIAIWGTLLAIFLAIPFGIPSASNIAPISIY